MKIYFGNPEAKLRGQKQLRIKLLDFEIVVSILNWKRLRPEMKRLEEEMKIKAKMFSR